RLPGSGRRSVGPGADRGRGRGGGLDARATTGLHGTGQESQRAPARPRGGAPAHGALSVARGLPGRTERVSERRAGILLPLFSLRSQRDWGVGDLGDVGPFCRWLAAAGHTVLQLLPIGEMAVYETSPYGALTAFALDPLYLDLDA